MHRNEEIFQSWDLQFLLTLLSLQLLEVFQLSLGARPEHDPQLSQVQPLWPVGQETGSDNMAHHE